MKLEKDELFSVEDDSMKTDVHRHREYNININHESVQISQLSLK